MDDAELTDAILDAALILNKTLGYTLLTPNQIRKLQGIPPITETTDVHR